MATRQLSVISSIKCSTCGRAIPINELPTHLCEAAIVPPLPNIPGQYSNFSSPNTSPQKQNILLQTQGYSKWGKQPPIKIDPTFANQSYYSSDPFSASDRSNSSSQTPITPATNITTPGSFISGKLSRTPSPPTEGWRSNFSSPQKPLPSPGFANMGGPKMARPDFMKRVDLAYTGPFGPKSPGLPPPSMSGWGNGPAQMRMESRTPSPYGDMPREHPAAKRSPQKNSPRLTEVDAFLEDMARTPAYLKVNDYSFSTSTPHLSSGPGPAFEEEPQPPFDDGFKPEPPRKNTPKIEQQPLPKLVEQLKPESDRPQTPPAIQRKGSSNARFNQFPPPKNMKKPASPVSRPSTRGEDRAMDYAPNPFSKPRITEPSKPSGMDPAVQMGLDEPFLRRSNSSPQEESTTSKTHVPTEAYHAPSLSDPHNNTSNPHRSFPAGSGPPKHLCRGCTRPIVGPSLKDSSGRLTGRYHRSCFTCTDCAAPFPSGDFYVWQNAPYCAAHYHNRNGTCCKGCGHGVEGPYAETDDRRIWHRSCFRCQDCGDMFNGPEYWEMGGRVVCGKHAGGQAMGRSEKRTTRFGMMGSGAPQQTFMPRIGDGNQYNPDRRPSVPEKFGPGQMMGGRPQMNGPPMMGASQFGNRLAPPDQGSRWL